MIFKQSLRLGIINRIKNKTEPNVILHFEMDT